MSKAILVLDEMPVECRQCNFIEIDYDMDVAICIACRKIVGDDIYFNKPIMRPAFCPLKPVPERKLEWFDDDRSLYECGYNACLSELFGEDDDDDD